MTTNWGREETSSVALWGEEDVQIQLEGCRSNRQVYEKIARAMSTARFERTFTQCRDKIKKLKAEYRATGEDRTEWEFF